jgi:hypothetical protein
MCLHNSHSFPQTDPITHLTTVQCFSCANRLIYSWESMKIVRKPMFPRIQQFMSERRYLRALRGFSR